MEHGPSCGVPGVYHNLRDLVRGREQQLTQAWHILWCPCRLSLASVYHNQIHLEHGLSWGVPGVYNNLRDLARGCKQQLTHASRILRCPCRLHLGQRLPQSCSLGAWPVLWCPWRLPQLKGPGARMRTATYSGLAHPAVSLAPTPWPASTTNKLTWGMWPVLWCPRRLPQLKEPGARMRTATYWGLAHPAVSLAPTPWPASTSVCLCLCLSLRRPIKSVCLFVLSVLILCGHIFLSRLAAQLWVSPLEWDTLSHGAFFRIIVFYKESGGILSDPVLR